MCRDVQGFEIVELVLHLGPLFHRESEPLEILTDADPRVRDRVQAAEVLASPRQGDIQGFATQALLQVGLLEAGFLLGDRLLKTGF